MDVEKTKKKISELENKSWDLDLIISNVNAVTKDIKYMDTPSAIYLKVEDMAAENNIDEDEIEFKVREIRECVNKLESAIYDLVEPFEDAKRDIDNETNELEWELEDYEYAS
jgi:hypothetical protein